MAVEQLVGISRSFDSYSFTSLREEVMGLYSLYPTALPENAISVYLGTAITDFNQDSYHPLQILYSGADRVIDLSSFYPNSVLEVSIVRDCVDTSISPSFSRLEGSIPGYADQIDRYLTYVEERASWGNIYKHFNGRLKFKFDSVTSKLYLRDIPSSQVRVTIIPDYTIKQRTWYLQPYQREAFINNTVQLLSWKNAEVLGKGAGYGVVLEGINAVEEKSKYDALREEFRSKAPPLYFGGVD